MGVIICANLDFSGSGKQALLGEFAVVSSNCSDAQGNLEGEFSWRTLLLGSWVRMWLW